MGPTRGIPEQPDFQRLFEAVPGLYLVLDPGLVIVAASQAYLDATMTTRADIIGRYLFDVFPDNPGDPAATGVANLRASLDVVRSDHVVHAMSVQKYDIQRPADQGGGFEVRYWSPLNSPVIDDAGRLEYIIHRVEDVTDYVLLQDRATRQVQRTTELEARESRMETEIFARSQELHELNRRLQAANSAKSDLLSRVSHELRTPLTAILGFSELIALAQPGDEIAGHNATVLRAAEHLLTLINDVLDVSRIDAGQMTVASEPVAVNAVVDEAADLVRPLARTLGVSLVVEGGLGAGYVQADKQRLKQVLINLLSNAVKYNGADGSVRIRAEVTASDRRRISVSDDGAGLSDSDLARLFVPFERLDAAERGIEGTGLGLSLSRSLAEAMGGSIGATSTPGRGSTFWVELPAVEPTAVEFTAGEQLPMAAVRTYETAKQVVYIEDTVANLHLVEKILERRPSVTVLPAMLGTMGVELVRDNHPDLVLLDLHLPDMHGDEVLHRIRMDPPTANTPVVILSADATPRTRSRLLKAGATGYLLKPITVTGLLDLVDHHLAGDDDDDEAVDGSGG